MQVRCLSGFFFLLLPHHANDPVADPEAGIQKDGSRRVVWFREMEVEA